MNGPANTLMSVMIDNMKKTVPAVADASFFRYNIKDWTFAYVRKHSCFLATNVDEELQTWFFAYVEPDRGVALIRSPMLLMPHMRKLCVHPSCYEGRVITPAAIAWHNVVTIRPVVLQGLARQVAAERDAFLEEGHKLS